MNKGTDMTDIELKTLFDDAFNACQATADGAMTRTRYARLIGAYEQLIKNLARSESDRRMVLDVVADFSYDALGKGE